MSSIAWAQNDPATAGGDAAGQEKELEVAVGIDEIVKLDFDFNTKVQIGNESLLDLVLAPQKKEITFKGRKPGRTSVTIRDNVGDVRIRYIVVVTASGKSQVVTELRELIGDVEGLEIKIEGGKVVVGGEIVVPSDITRVNTVLETYQDILRLVTLSPQTQRVIARKMMDELARNNLKDVTVRVVNGVFWLEGVVSSKDKKDLAVAIANAYLPDKISLDTKGLSSVKRESIIDFISVNEKKDPAPPPKQLKITSQFVELSKDYSRIFGFKWAPLMSQDQSAISFGQNSAGGVTSTSSNTLSATISNLFPKLNSARSAGYARIVQSGMVVTKDQVKANINKQTDIPFAVGTGDFTRASTASVGFAMDVTPKILEQEKVELGVGIDVKLTASVSTSGTPISTTNKVQTTVVIKSKESAAIGGIVQNQSTTSYDKDDPAPSQASGGGAPPQALFRILRSKNHQISRNQYVMFLTPEIIESASTGTEEIRKKFRRRSN
ncbi:MAG: pilus assembly protein N-terminal domain-containing protein [Bacteriovoracaceae bacterium]|nr:pilus assembly protein N-terminal domain-containing protein [Bacteriovoracaceae bacterium]